MTITLLTSANLVSQLMAKANEIAIEVNTPQMVATPSANGFMSAADKTNLDAVGTDLVANTYLVINYPSNTLIHSLFVPRTGGDRAYTDHVEISHAQPMVRMTETGVTAENTAWSIDAQAESMNYRMFNDAYVTSNIYFQVARTGVNIDEITLKGDLLTLTVDQIDTIGNIALTNGAPLIRFEESDAAAENQNWDFTSFGEQMAMRVVTDNLAGANTYLQVHRTGLNLDTMTLKGDLITLSSANVYTGAATVTASGFRTNGRYRCSGSGPVYEWENTAQASAEIWWDMVTSGTSMLNRVYKEGGGESNNYIWVTRTGVNIDTIQHKGDLIQSTGNHYITGTLDIGHASDTTIQRVSAGLISVEGENVPTVDSASEWTGAQNFNETTVTSTTNSVAWNAATNQVTTHTLTEDTTIAAPTNIPAGRFISLRVIQHASAAKTLGWNAVFKWAGGSAPTMTVTVSAVDVYNFWSDGTNLHSVGFQQDVS